MRVDQSQADQDSHSDPTFEICNSPLSRQLFDGCVVYELIGYKRFLVCIGLYSQNRQKNRYDDCLALWLQFMFHISAFSIEFAFDGLYSQKIWSINVCLARGDWVRGLFDTLAPVHGPYVAVFNRICI